MKIKKSSFIAKIHVLPPVFCVFNVQTSVNQDNPDSVQLDVKLAFKKDTNQTSIANNSEISF